MINSKDFKLDVSDITKTSLGLDNVQNNSNDDIKALVVEAVPVPTKADMGLDQVGNYSPANMPLSNATVTANANVIASIPEVDLTKVAGTFQTENTSVKYMDSTTKLLYKMYLDNGVAVYEEVEDTRPALTRAELDTMIANGDDVRFVNTSEITNMDELFRDSSFNQDISTWDVSSVLDMSYMFYNSQFNQDISSWDVSSVTSCAQFKEDAILTCPNTPALDSGCTGC